MGSFLQKDEQKGTKIPHFAFAVYTTSFPSMSVGGQKILWQPQRCVQKSLFAPKMIFSKFFLFSKMAYVMQILPH